MAEQDTHDEEGNREERLLTLYSELRQEIRMRIRQSSRQFLATTAAAVTVLGYAATQDTGSLVAVVPLLIGFAIVQAVSTYNEMAQVASHLAEIERSLSSDEGLFRYEIRQGGMFGGERHSDPLWLVADVGPRAALALSAYALYAFAAFSTVGLWENDVVFEFGWMSLVIDELALSVLYTLVGCLLVVIGASHIVLRVRLAEDRSLPRFVEL